MNSNTYVPTHCIYTAILQRHTVHLAQHKRMLPATEEEVVPFASGGMVNNRHANVSFDEQLLELALLTQ